MKNRKALDLPTTDPGSDLYDMSDSGDENNYCSSAIEIDEKGKSSGDERLSRGKENCQNKNGKLSLPAIVRPRSLSLSDEFNAGELARKHKIRLKHRRQPMYVFNKIIVRKNLTVSVIYF